MSSGPGTPAYIAPTQAAESALVLVFGIVGGLFGLGWCAYFFFGQWQKALLCGGLFVVVPILIIVLGLATCGVGWLLLPIYAIVLIPVAIVNVIDAHLQNECLRQGFAIGHWTWFSNHL